MQSMDDTALLAEYAATGSEQAFSELVTRHINLVHSAAFRQLRDPILAQDVTQAVFVVLAQKARKISNKTVLSGWLFKTTRFAALAQMRAEAKWHRREQEAQMQNEIESSAAEETWNEIAPQLDKALGTLKTKDREALLLRYFENKSMADVGRALNAREDAARMRVGRALEKLRKFFAKRGIASTTAVIAGMISANSVQAAPAGLASDVTAAAIHGPAAAVSTLALVKGTINMMKYAKLKWATGIAVVLLVAAGSATIAISQTGGGDSLTVQEIARQSQKTYAALSSYSDTGTVVTEGGGAATKTTFAIHLQRPNLYRVDWTSTGGFYTSRGAAWSDGTENYFAFGSASEFDSIKPEKERDLQTALASGTGISSSASSDIPGTFFDLNWGGQLKTFSSRRATVRREHDQKTGDTDCFVVSRTLPPVKLPNNMGSSGTSTTRLWIGKQDHLIHQIESTIEGGSTKMPITDDSLRTILERQGKPATSDAMAALRKEMESELAQTGKIVFTQTHENISTGQKFSPSDFTRAF